MALDVARILCSSVDDLANTDISAIALQVRQRRPAASCFVPTPSTLQALRRSRIRHVHLVGRRGAAQAQFSNKELREVVSKKSFPVLIRPDQLVLNEASAIEAVC